VENRAKRTVIWHLLVHSSKEGRHLKQSTLKKSHCIELQVNSSFKKTMSLIYLLATKNPKNLTQYPKKKMAIKQAFLVKLENNTLSRFQKMKMSLHAK
jgi:hypothetical protein